MEEDKQYEDAFKLAMEKLEREAQKDVDQAVMKYAPHFILGSSAIGLLCGFSVSMFVISRKKKIPMGRVPMALGALGGGTLLCTAGATAFVFLAKTLLGVKNVNEFSTLMRQNISPKMQDILNNNNTVVPEVERDMTSKVEVLPSSEVVSDK
eukprot:TRINITY_DN7493_c0_g1_i1.p1 TRINITY_DN7493_c0_g1~~TRINITY_DN7493_c0_g1_i1.p1  ORF type:complete len:160 (+),score=46.72 TRINITY_DN7493_c0_g1_i1:25-480(+)